MGDHFSGEIWYLLSRVGCDHPCFSFVFSCGYLGLFLLLVVCSCIYVCCFCFLGVVLFSNYLCWSFWFFVMLVSWLFPSQSGYCEI